MKTAKEIQSMSISESTAKCLEAVTMLSDIWGCVSDALTTLYGEAFVDDIMEKDFVPQVEALQSTLEKYLLCSITENFAHIDSAKL